MNRLFIFRSSIFGHLFYRLAAIHLLLAVLFFYLISNHFHKTSEAYSAEQGEIFTNSVLGAIKTSLYEKNYGEVIDYSMALLHHTNTVQYLIISTLDGQELLIQKDHWQLGKSTLGYADLAFESSKPNAYLSADTSLLTKTDDVYVYHLPIAMSGKQWGVITAIFSKNHVSQIKNKFLLQLTIVTVMMVLAMLLIFILITKKVRTQFESITETIAEISAGQLDKQLNENMLGELKYFSKAINHMLNLLNDNNKHLFRVLSAIEQTNEVFIMISDTQRVIFVNKTWGCPR